MEKRELQRVQYWQGQMLRSQDFGDNEAVEAQRRWWHNRAEHAAFGISRGLEATANNDVTAVLVQPGVAYDCFGRELILENAQTIPVPSPLNVSSAVLLMKYLSPAGVPRSTATAEVCWTDGALRFAAAEFFWKPTEAVRTEDGVAIAQVFYTGQGRKIDREFFRRPTQTAARPLVATGTTIRGKTPWQATSLGPVKNAGQIIEVSTRVDTSAAGFTPAPCYFAWLGGPALHPKTGKLLPLLFTSIRDEAADSFTLAYWVYKTASGSNTVPLNSGESGASFAAASPPRVERPDLFVVWIGCQMPPAIPFVPLGERTSNRLVLKKILKQ